MRFVEISSFDSIQSFPKSAYGIPEPPDPSPQEQRVVDDFDIDLIIVPGVAFDKFCSRLGHGIPSCLSPCLSICRRVDIFFQI